MSNCLRSLSMPEWQTRLDLMSLGTLVLILAAIAAFAWAVKQGG